MTTKYKNGWGIPNKNGDKVMAKLRVGKVTIFDLYFTIGVPKATLTVMNYTFDFSK